MSFLAAAATHADSGLTTWQVVGLFAGIPAVVITAVFAACYVPLWTEKARAEKARTRASTPETAAPAPSVPPRPDPS